MTALFSRVEPALLRYLGHRAEVATVVTHGDIEAVSKFGFLHVELVRNAPLLAWRAPYAPPPEAADGCLSAVLIGSIFEGRGYEILLRAVAKARPQRDIFIKVYGSGRKDYVASLKGLTESLGIGDLVEWMGPIDSSDVSSAYLSAQVGLVLYEAVDLGNDGLSNKILECVSSGRPVIAGDLPENRRFVASNCVGWLTGVDVDSIASALVSAGAGEDLFALSLRCRRLGDTWLNWESEFERVLTLVGTGRLGRDRVVR